MHDRGLTEISFVVYDIASHFDILSEVTMDVSVTKYLIGVFYFIVFALFAHLLARWKFDKFPLLINLAKLKISAVLIFAVNLIDIITTFLFMTNWGRIEVEANQLIVYALKKYGLYAFIFKLVIGSILPILTLILFKCLGYVTRSRARAVFVLLLAYSLLIMNNLCVYYWPK